MDALLRIVLPRPGLSAWAGAAFAWIELCLSRRRERQALAALNDGQLKDIGLSRADVELESRRWAWDGSPRPQALRSQGR